MSSVFLSHSHADKDFARKLAADLRLAGHGVWIDEAEINIGDSLIEKIREGLDQVDYVAAILSSSSIGSPWVTRELDIASNREIKEGRVVVLPLLVEKVKLPGFLEGKFYGDFTEPSRYKDALDLLLRKLGPAEELPKLSHDEIAALRQELALAQAAVAQHESALRVHHKIALKGKSDALVAAIEKANKRYPSHAPINIVYAFEVSNMPLTLDYVLWSIAKAQQRGGHPLDILLTLEDKWDEVKAMLDAYDELLTTAEANK